MSVSRVLPAILSDRLAETRDFYVHLLGFQIAFESDFFIELVSPTHPGAQLGIWLRDHDTVPMQFRHAPAGVVVSFGTDDLEGAYREAQRRNLNIVQPIRTEEYGQRHFMTTDPNGLLIDVTSPIPMSQEFVARHGLKP